MVCENPVFELCGIHFIDLRVPAAKEICFINKFVSSLCARVKLVPVIRGIMILSTVYDFTCMYDRWWSVSEVYKLLCRETQWLWLGSHVSRRSVEYNAMTSDIHSCVTMLLGKVNVNGDRMRLKWGQSSLVFRYYCILFGYTYRNWSTHCWSQDYNYCDTILSLRHGQSFA